MPVHGSDSYVNQYMDSASMTRKEILTAFEKIYFNRFRIHLPEVRVKIVEKVYEQLSLDVDQKLILLA